MEENLSAFIAGFGGSGHRWYRLFDRTRDGRRAKGFALAEAAAWRTANRQEIRGLQHWLARRPARARAWERLSIRTMKRRTYPAGLRAVRAFAAAGFRSDNRALSQAP